MGRGASAEEEEDFRPGVQRFRGSEQYLREGALGSGVRGFLLQFACLLNDDNWLGVLLCFPPEWDLPQGGVLLAIESFLCNSV